jgi:uncharacterized membrane protein YuzA (DUF378 family)
MGKAFALLSAAALSLGLMSPTRFDLVWEPFGPMFVLSRTIGVAAALGLVCQWIMVHQSPTREYVRIPG